MKKILLLVPMIATISLYSTHPGNQNTINQNVVPNEEELFAILEQVLAADDTQSDRQVPTIQQPSSSDQQVPSSQQTPGHTNRNSQ